jgi:hypothetical protein
MPQVGICWLIDGNLVIEARSSAMRKHMVISSPGPKGVAQGSLADANLAETLQCGANPAIAASAHFAA